MRCSHSVLENRRNKNRPLDCWAEVESFKDAVAQAQKEFCLNHA